MRVAIFLVAILGFSTAVPVSQVSLKQRLESPDASVRNSAVEDMINTILDSLRELMLNGTDIIPILDPLIINGISLDGALLGFPGSFISLQDMSLKGLSTFEIDQMSVSSFLFRYTVNFDISIPTVEVATENYDMNINIFGGQVYGSGNMILKLERPRLKGTVVVGVRLSIGGVYLTIHECDLGIGLDAFKPEITGMFGNQVTSDFIAAFLENLIPELLDFFEEDLSKILSTVVLTVGNLILDDFNLIGIIGN